MLFRGLDIMNLLPTHSEAPSWVKKASRVGRERTSNWKDHSQFAQGLHYTVQHDTDEEVCKQN